MVAAQNMKSWRQAAMKSTRAREIYEALQEEIKRTGLQPELQVIAARNAKFIRSVPREIAQHLTQKAVSLQQEGKRDLEIVAELKKLAPRLTKSKMRLIARTEISRAESQLTELRSENLGLDWYQWLTSRDARVRDSHKHMDNVLISWSDPPSPEALIHVKSKLGKYHAGCAPNDRCMAAPLVSLDEVSWPAKVYRNNGITRMSRAQFVKLLPAGQLVAA
jgi:SPP1 gp7 family putative phage head morphogenesis protein